MEFGTAGYTMDHVFVLYDRESETVWYPGDKGLEAVGGERKGQSIPFLEEPAPVALGEWLDAHPDSTVLLPSERDFKAINRPTLGVRVEDRNDAIVVSRVGDESPAALAGLEVGDRLHTLDGHAIVERKSLREILMESTAGDTVDLVVERDGELLTLRPTLAER